MDEEQQNVDPGSGGDSSQRYFCPYPGCNRSFGELWRLKVHYRADPSVRGSGKERGHGMELAFCPKCNKELTPGKHHVGCSAGPKTGAARVAKRSRHQGDELGQATDRVKLPTMEAGSMAHTVFAPGITDGRMMPHAGGPIQQQQGLPFPMGMPQHAGMGPTLFAVHYPNAGGMMIMQLPSQGGLPQPPPGMMPACWPGFPGMPGMPPMSLMLGNQSLPGVPTIAEVASAGTTAAGGNQRVAPAPCTSNEAASPAGRELLGGIFDDCQLDGPSPYRIPSPPPIPSDFHAPATGGVPGSNGMLFDFGQFSESMSAPCAQTGFGDRHFQAMASEVATTRLTDSSDALETQEERQLMKLLFGMSEERQTGSPALHSYPPQVQRNKDQNPQQRPVNSYIPQHVQAARAIQAAHAGQSAGGRQQAGSGSSAEGSPSALAWNQPGDASQDPWSEQRASASNVILDERSLQLYDQLACGGEGQFQGFDRQSVPDGFMDAKWSAMSSLEQLTLMRALHSHKTSFPTAPAGATSQAHGPIKLEAGEQLKVGEVPMDRYDFLDMGSPLTLSPCSDVTGVACPML